MSAGGTKNKFNNNHKKSKSTYQTQGHRVWHSGDKLAVIPPKAGAVGLNHNYFPWYREWSVRIGSYGETYKRQFENGESSPFDIDDEMKDLDVKPELSVSEAAFQLTEEQLLELEEMVQNDVSRMRRDNLKAKWFEEWVDDRQRQNLAIRAANNYFTEKMKRGIAKEDEDRDKSTLIFSDILASMSENSQRLVRAHKYSKASDPLDGPARDGDGDSTSNESHSSGGLARAEAAKDWMYLFRAAKDTHVRKVSGLSALELERRIINETKTLETMYHGRGTFTRWTERFEDQIKCLESLNYDLPDIRKRSFFMANLNKELFPRLLSDWNNVRMQGEFPDNFEELLSYVSQEYITITNTNPSLVLRVERPPKDEFSMKTSEDTKSGDKKANCYICGGNHTTDGCKWRNTEYSVESNKKYFLRDQKRKTESSGATGASAGEKSQGKTDSKYSKSGTDESKWDPTKGTVAEKPTKKEGSNHIVELLYTDTEIMDRVLCNISEEAYNKVKEQLPEELVFIYDTASASGALVPGYEGAITNQYHEPTHIVGQGGGYQLSDTAGTNVFGRFRQLKSAKGNSNLISHAQAEKNWQIYHIKPGYIQLREWEHNKIKTGKIWHLYSEPDIWGDSFPRLVIRREELPELLASSSNIEGCLTFYEPNLLPAQHDLSTEQLNIIEKVNNIHLRLSHTGADALIRMIKAEENVVTEPHTGLGISTAEVEVWRRYRGNFCSGCIQGKMRDHSRVKSTANRKFKVGEAVGGDLIFVDGRLGKSPCAVLVDMASGYTFATHLTDKTGAQLLRTLQVVKGHYSVYGHSIKYIYWDREKGVESISNDILSLGMETRLKAANQHVGKVETVNRLIRETVRSVKCGVYDLYDYKVPIQWNKFIVLDAVNVINRRIPIGHSSSPFTTFTGLSYDRQRDFRVDIGHPIIVKRAKRPSADMDKQALWGVPVLRYMNREGTIMVYIVQTRSYRHIIKFVYAKIPSWVIASLKSISDSEPIRFDHDDDGPPGPDSEDTISVEWDDEEVTPTHVVDALDAVDKLGDEAHDLSPEESSQLEMAKETLAEVYHEEAEEPDFPDFVEHLERVPEQPERPVVRLRGAERELRGLQVTPSFIFPNVEPVDISDTGGLRRSTRPRKDFKPINIEKFNILVEYHYILYEQALKSDKREAAIKALDKELDVAESMNVWEPIYENSLSDEERKFIIDAMTNYVEKWLASGGFDKSKVRVLARGDQQTEFGDTASPVARIESVFLIAIIAALYDLEVFKFDVVSAYLNTNMPEEVVHKWLLLPKHVSARLVERNREKYGAYMRRDNKILVRMNKLLYGYKEAALGWFKTFMELFDINGYSHAPKDKCFIFKHDDRDNIIMSAITVDDGFGAVSRNSGMKETFLNLIKTKFSITLTEADEFDYLGMSFKFDRANKAVSISQRQYIDKLITNFNVTKSAKTPSLADLFEEDPASPLLKDQLGFLALNSSCNFAASRTYPEVLPCSSTLAAHYYKATEQDHKRGLRMIEYMKSDANHELYLRPKSLKMVGYADASYAERSTGHSQTGGCIGVEGVNTPCLFIFCSSKQTIIAKSSCEAELIAANTIGDYFVWLREVLEALHLSDGSPATLYQDNKATILIGEKGTGSFKRTKHIRVRYFWLTELISRGELKLEYVPTDEMIADILTKPLIGNSFRYLRDKLLGISNKPNM